jgi:transcriptional regulator with GAF, ATPase, and Fis domain
MDANINEFFRQATLRICGSLDIDRALFNTCAYLEKFLPLDAVGLYLYDPALNLVTRVARVSRDAEDAVGRISPLPEGSREFWSAIWTEMKDIRIINRPDTIPAMRDAARLHGLDLNISIIVMRLELDGRRLGLVSLKAKGHDRYTEKHARRIRVLHEPFAVAMTNALAHQELLRLKEILTEDNQYLRNRISELSETEIVGATLGLRHVMEMVRQVANLDSPVLLLGETGVGKGMIANAIHYHSARKNRPFVTVNCGAIPDSLMDSELFGHEKGAFTGAVFQKKGRFERAHQGTIFLDEIGELPAPAQVRLLHVVQEKTIERVGGTEAVPVDVRIVSATHRNLEDMVRSQTFREDLWFRLNVFPIHIPPLRQRRDDIPILVHHFIEKKSIELRLKDKPEPAPDALEQLCAYPWPGNVRELENTVERALIQYRGGLLRFDLLASDRRVISGAPEDDLLQNAVGGGLMSLDRMNTLYIKRALAAAAGKVSGPGGAAEMLKIHPNTLRKRMDKLGIDYKGRNGTPHVKKHPRKVI